MMIKGIVKIQSFNNNKSIVARCSKFIPLFQNHKNFFSSGKQTPNSPQNNNSNNNKIKITGFQMKNITNINDKADSKKINMYTKIIGQKIHLLNAPLLKRLNNLNKLLYPILPHPNQNYFNKLASYKNLFYQNYQKILYVMLAIFVMGGLLFSFLIKKVDSNILAATKQKQKLQQHLQSGQSRQFIQLAQKFYEDSNKKIEQSIVNATKIYIQAGRSLKLTQYQDQGNEQNRPNKRLIYYKITLEDKNGKSQIADSYFGDPNNFLKYVQFVQQKHHVTERAEVIYKNNQAYNFKNALTDTLGFLTPFIPILITVYIFRKTDPTTFLNKLGRNAKQFKVEAMKDIKTRFHDVAGMEQAKKEITQFVDFLKNNQRYQKMGAKIPKGALLTGPPGTGKTMLARACAGQAGVSFFYISGSEFVEIFVGLGAAKVRDLFAKARQNAPSIIFIDQIDAIGKKRETSRNEEKDSTLNQLLVEMDGFSSHETIVVLAATNRKQILDNALTRPGRFDRIVQITLPDVKAREQIFMVHLKPLKIDPSKQIRSIAKRLAELSPGFSGADISNLCNQAAIIATRNNKNYITDRDFEEATERITAGYVKKSLMKEKTKKRVAYHEAGHAVSSWFLKGGDPLVKLTIIPRSKGALGYAQYLPKTTYIMSRSEMIDKVAIMLGGITTEQIFFGQISSGGSDDLQKVYGLARRMITQFGMGQNTYNMTLDQQSYIQKQSTFLSDKMEEEVNNIVQEARKRSRETIQSKKDVIQALAKQLIEKQTINAEEILKIMGNRPEFELVKQQIKNNEQEVTKQKHINI